MFEDYDGYFVLNMVVDVVGILRYQNFQTQKLVWVYNCNNNGGTFKNVEFKELIWRNRK